MSLNFSLSQSIRKRELISTRGSRKQNPPHIAESLRPAEYRGLTAKRRVRLEWTRFQLLAILQTLLDFEAFAPSFAPGQQAGLDVDTILRDHFEKRPELLEQLARKMDMFCTCGGAR